MDFTFDEDALLFQQTVRDFLGNECTPEHVRARWDVGAAHDPALWNRLAELGIPGLLVPEAHGGLGLDERTSVLLFEEFGRAALPEPVIATVAAGAPALREIGGALADEWLPKLAAGEAIVAVGHEASPFVSDADVADLLLLPVDDAIHAVRPADCELVFEPSNDPSRRLFSVGFDPGATPRAAVAEGARAVAGDLLVRGSLAAAAELLGATDRMIELSAEYTGQRHQFGKPIGSFQAVKHQLADCKVKLEYARPVVHRAAHSVATAHPDRALHVSMAKVAAGDAATFTARRALQVHGAIGYTWEQDLHLWMRRAWSLEQAYGKSARHRQNVESWILAEDARLGPGATFRAA